MLDYYRRNNESVAFEGTDFSPSWVSALRLPNYLIKAAYVGYTQPSHIDAILSHAKHNKHDWINDWLTTENGDVTKIRNWVKQQVLICEQLKHEAEANGYPFFNMSTQTFDEYKTSVLNYLVGS